MYDERGVYPSSFKLNEYTTNSSLFAKIEHLPVANGTQKTAFGEALTFVNNETLNYENGYRGRQAFLTLFNANPE